MEQPEGTAADSRQSPICQRRGRGFVFVDTYRDLLERRAVKVKTPVQCATCFRKGEPLPKQRGKVKWSSSRRKYGFIVTDKGLEIFVHQRQMLDDEVSEPKENQSARFHIVYSPKGPEAMNVELSEPDS
jgi:cold shock CspA family protein